MTRGSAVPSCICSHCPLGTVTPTKDAQVLACSYYYLPSIYTATARQQLLLLVAVAKRVPNGRTRVQMMMMREWVKEKHKSCGQRDAVEEGHLLFRALRGET